MGGWSKNKQGSGGANPSLSNITDVDVINKVNGYALIYDATSSKFKSQPLPAGSGSGATSMSGLSDVDVTTTAPVNNNVLTFENGKWIPQVPSVSGSSLGSYTLELVRWGVINSISNTSDATVATNNSNGINNALVWASQQGYGEVILPVGSYLIHETIPIAPQSFQTLNLGGSTIRIRDNREVKYMVIAFTNNQVFSKVTNGKVQGDRYNHDYYYWNSDASVGKAWTKWQANHAYIVGDKIMPTNVIADNYTGYWQCTVAGSSGATEPNWNGNTADNGITWTSYSRHTHEWGYGIGVGSFTPPNSTGSNTRFISIDNIEMFELTGDGVTHQTVNGTIYLSDSTTIPLFESGSIYIGESPNATYNNWLSGTHYGVNAYVKTGADVYKCTTSPAGTSTNQPSGQVTQSYADGYTWQYLGTLGALISSTTRVRLKQTILMNNANITKWNYFGIYGGSYGQLGSDIVATALDIVFFNSDNSYNSSLYNVTYFDDVNPPSGASYAKILLHQGTVPTSANTGITVRVAEYPKYTYTEKCNIHHCRRLAISITGAKHVYIKNNDLHHISGTGPAGTIDVEDGYRLNQYLYIHGNNMHDTQTGLTVAAGRFIDISNNRITDAMTIWDSSDHTNIYNNMIFTKINLWGEVTFAGNRIVWGGVSVATVNSNDRPAVIADNYFYNSSFNISRGIPYSVVVSNCIVSTDYDYYSNLATSGNGVLGLGSVPQTITNCIFSGGSAKSGAYMSASSASVDPWIVTGCTFYNTKHQDGISNGLPSGMYTDCRFINSGTMQFVNNSAGNINAKYEFNGCYYQWDGYYLFGTASNMNVYSIRFNNCYFAGGSTYAFYLYGTTGRMSLNNCIFDYPNSTGTGNILYLSTTFVPTSLIITNCQFRSNRAMVIIDASNATFTSVPIIFKDNVTDTVTLTLQSSHIRKNNVINGTLTDL